MRTSRVMEAMSRIVDSAGSLAYQIQDDSALKEEDREALLNATSRICATAICMLDWLRDHPLETPRN